jgi:EF-hand domain pair
MVGLFHVFDLDNDGFIEHDELLLILKWLYKVNPPVGLTIEELSDQVFEALDSDHDEKITLAEFALGFKRVPLLQQNLSFLNQLVTSSLPHVPAHNLSPPQVRSPRSVSSPPEVAHVRLAVPGAPTGGSASTSLVSPRRSRSRSPSPSARPTSVAPPSE